MAEPRYARFRVKPGSIGARSGCKTNETFVRYGASERWRQRK